MSRHIVYRDKSLICLVAYDSKEDAFTFEMRKNDVRSKSYYRTSDPFALNTCLDHVRGYGSLSSNVREAINQLLSIEASTRQDDRRTYSWDKDIPFEENNFLEW